MKKLLLVVIFVLMLLPMYFMLIGGFQNINGVMKMPPDMIPHNPTFENYERMLSWPIGGWLLNTVVSTGAVIVLSTLVSALTAYPFAFHHFRFKEVLWAVLLIGIMVPKISIIIPTYVIIRKIGLSGQLISIVLTLIYNPSGVFLARLYFDTIPRSLLESARLDGANEWQVLTRIVMPMSRPLVTALGLFSAIAVLGDYLWQLLVLQNPDNQTLMVGMMGKVFNIGATIQGGVNPIAGSLAVGTVLLVPLLLIFLVANRYFTQDIGGAIKE